MSKERRIHVRIPIETRLNEFLELPHGREIGRGICKDLSRGGICVLCTQTLTMKQKVLINFSIPGLNHGIRCEGVVRWIAKDSMAYLIGIEFLNLASDQQKTVNAFIRKHHGGGSFFVNILSALTGRR